MRGGPPGGRGMRSAGRQAGGGAAGRASNWRHTHNALTGTRQQGGGPFGSASHCCLLHARAAVPCRAAGVGETYTAVLSAFKLGWRHVDTAQVSARGSGGGGRGAGAGARVGHGMFQSRSPDSSAGIGSVTACHTRGGGSRLIAAVCRQGQMRAGAVRVQVEVVVRYGGGAVPGRPAVPDAAL